MRKAAAKALIIMLAACGVLLLALPDVRAQGVSSAPPAGMKAIAENASYAMYAKMDNGEFALRNKADGRVMYSNPQNRADDPIAKNKFKKELASALIIGYLDTTTNQEGSVNSEIGCVGKGGATVTKNASGMSVRFDFVDLGIVITVVYTLNSDGLTASIDTKNIRESGASRLLWVSVLPYLLSAGTGDSGYLFVPDGCGAVINLNNGKTFQGSGYEQQVYGADPTRTLDSAPNVEQPIRLPVYGISAENGGMFAVIESGDANAYIDAGVSGYQTSYNNVYAKFTTRASDTYSMGTSASAVTTKMYQMSAMPAQVIRIRYYPMAKGACDYSDMALRYRGWLIDNRHMTTGHDSDDLYTVFYGAVRKSKSVVGVPTEVTEALTTFNQAGDMLRQLKEAGVGTITLNYKNWNDANIQMRQPSGTDFSGDLGGARAFHNLAAYAKNSGVKLFTDVDFTYYENGSAGGAAKLIANIPADQKPFDLSTGYENTAKPWGFLTGLLRLSPLVRQFTAALTPADTAGVGLTSMGNTLYSDYTTKSYSRQNTLAAYADCVKMLTGAKRRVLTSGNAYMLPAAEFVEAAPIDSSGYDLEDGAVPFYEIALSGLIAMSTPPINLSPNPDVTRLKAVEYGICPAFTFYQSEPQTVRDTGLNRLYACQFLQWGGDAISAYKQFHAMRAAVGDSAIVSHRELAANLFETTYENGACVIVNYNDSPVNVQETEVGGMSFAVQKG